MKSTKRENERERAKLVLPVGDFQSLLFPWDSGGTSVVLRGRES